MSEKKLDLKAELATLVRVQEGMVTPGGFKLGFDFDKTEAWFHLSMPDQSVFTADVVNYAQAGIQKIYIPAKEIAESASVQALYESSSYPFKNFMRDLILKWREDSRFELPKLEFIFD